MSKVNPSKATGAHISLVGHITSEELRATLRASEVHSGFANRFLWFHVEGGPLQPFGGQAVDVSDIQKKISEAVAYAKATALVLVVGELSAAR
jgi:hypothetical protein